MISLMIKSNLITRFAGEHPDWLPVVDAAVAVAERAEASGGEFSGAWVVDELVQRGGPRWIPNLRILVSYGLLEKSGPSTRGGRRAYYRMPDHAAVAEALRPLQSADGAREVEERVRVLKRMIDLAVEYHDQAVRCANVGCFPAACVMIGAALEAELVGMALVFEADSKQHWPSGKGRPETWGLNDLAVLALDAEWFPSQLPNVPGQGTVSRAEIKEMLDFVRNVRNRAAHPGRSAREPGPEPDQREYELAYAITRTTFDYTYEHLERERRREQHDSTVAD